MDRDSRSRLLATLARRFGDLDLAEDTLQEAIAQALVTWPRTGVPSSPEAWLTTTAKRKALDVLRRESVLAQKLARLHVDSDRSPLPAGFTDPAEQAEPPTIPDERLGLFFACTHPVLKAEDRVALTLRFVAGLTTAEVAHALLLPVTTAQQRIVRAKKRIRTLGVPFDAPGPDDLPTRLPGVLRVVYLLYAEGYARSAGTDHIRDDLTAEAIRLARLLAALLPGAETTGLLALLILTQARRPARVDGTGSPIPLAQQDRALWDSGLVAEGTSLAERAAGSPDAGTYTIQAAIAAVHAEAPCADETDWEQIAVLYGMLESREPGPVVSLGRAVAHGRATGPAEGLRLLDALADDPALAQFRPYHVARALTLVELGDDDAAAAAYRRALELPGNEAEDDYLAAALAGCESSISTSG
ncbi:RNA polymerase sigma factor [Gordonia araii]|nr:sigma-70 family RNA polymerase sigma factor [Gordonia araii]NNG96755.1 sigma-70 family RNA polymerase sigma factor [Gordonia araii NBRC 100433]